MYDVLRMQHEEPQSDLCESAFEHLWSPAAFPTATTRVQRLNEAKVLRVLFICLLQPTIQRKVQAADVCLLADFSLVFRLLHKNHLDGHLVGARLGSGQIYRAERALSE